VSQCQILVVAENLQNFQQIQCDDPQIHSESILSLGYTKELAERPLLRVLDHQFWSLFRVRYINQIQHNFYSDPTWAQSSHHNLDHRLLSLESRCIYNH
jgi:hypothetical protein